MDFFRKLSGRPLPKDIAKDRLKLILIHDRGAFGDLPPETLEKIRNEVLEVISKYVEIEQEDVEISVNNTQQVEGSNPALVANIPLKNVRNR